MVISSYKEAEERTHNRVYDDCFDWPKPIKWNRVGIKLINLN